MYLKGATDVFNFIAHLESWIYRVSYKYIVLVEDIKCELLNVKYNLQQSQFNQQLIANIVIRYRLQTFIPRVYPSRLRRRLNSNV